MSGRFAWLRVWPGQGRATGRCAGGGPVWLLIEEQSDGELKYASKYASSDLPADTRRIEAVRLWRGRRPVEQGYQQMKEEFSHVRSFTQASWKLPEGGDESLLGFEAGRVRIGQLSRNNGS